MAQIYFNKQAVNAGECVAEAWEALKPQFWLFLGMIAVAYLLMMITSCIPLLGAAISGPFLCGIFAAALTVLRKRPLQFETIFDGFRIFLPAALTSVIITLPATLNQILDLVLNGFRLTAVIQGEDPDSGLSEGTLFFFLAVRIVLFIITLIASYLFIFAFALLIDKRLTVGAALSTSAKAVFANFGGVFVLCILNTLIILGGILVFCIGFFFAFPLVLTTTAAAYRAIFPDEESEMTPDFQPPTPDAYFGSY
ncbi:MAG: hypothetical protein ACK5NT_11810 [Pyrinomonadaceae bacterium]